ncbi:hypothetical protein ECK5_37150 [Escherichia coli O10:K5(L):H4 str. ATCC 23506]|nr:hypothetical protein ECK5_37150 [Escherichia coli O10:K5(L):H4 str. ATCC 23506]
MLPSETMIWQPEFTDKTLSRKPGAVHIAGITFKCRLAKSGDQFLWVDRIHADTFSQLPCQRCECCTHPFYTSESISTWW